MSTQTNIDSSATCSMAAMRSTKLAPHVCDTNRVGVPTTAASSSSTYRQRRAAVSGLMILSTTSAVDHSRGICFSSTNRLSQPTDTARYEPMSTSPLCRANRASSSAITAFIARRSAATRVDAPSIFTFALSASPDQ